MIANLIPFLLGYQRPTFTIKYSELNENIEQVTNVLHFIAVKIVLVFTLVPALFVTIINYFIYDLNDAAYVLPFSVMYAKHIRT